MEEKKRETEIETEELSEEQLEQIAGGEGLKIQVDLGSDNAHRITFR